MAGDLCDLAYTVLVERLERHVADERLVAATLIAGGATDLSLPSLADERSRFDLALVTPPAPLDHKRLALLNALGVRP